LYRDRSTGRRADSRSSSNASQERLTRMAQDRRTGAGPYLGIPCTDTFGVRIRVGIVAAPRQRPLPLLSSEGWPVEAAGAVDAQTAARPQAPWMPANDRRHPQPPQAAPNDISTENEKEETDVIDSAADALRAKPVAGSSKLSRGTPPTGFRRRNNQPIA